MRFLLALATLATLASCGANGEPTAPGLRVSGEASVGIVTSN
jgi:hypothetical protein